MNSKTKAPRRNTLLIIMDGMGVNPAKQNNAVALASTPKLDRIYASHNSCLLEASGRAVGLPDGQMGNSEVGHLSIGAGTILKQDLVKIDDAVNDGSFFENAALTDAVKRAKAAERPIHLLGLVSDGGVHSHLDHLLALIEMCRLHKVKPIVHMIADGRDTPQNSANSYLGELSLALDNADGAIETVIGRYYALDRDNRWERVQQAFNAIMRGQGREATSPEHALQLARENGETDEFLLPTVLDGYEVPKPGDEFIFFNYRNDRPRELSEALALDDFTDFDRGACATISLTTMTRYKSSYTFPIAFAKDEAGETLGQVVSDAGIEQLRCAETEKYPHVTFFFNGGKDDPLPGESRLMAKSPNVATYDLQPEMSADEVTTGIEAALNENRYGLVVVNFANADMVGHTGVADAVIKSVEVVDEMVGRLWEAAIANNYSIVLTADHGNADMLLDPVTGAPHTQHTTFPVPCVVHDSVNWKLRCGHGLPALAPTILQLMGLPQPEEMQGQSLLLGEI
ncbi:MAG: 2,3-bisphosphoglycerate-independent phosphoglycerate mutase [Granulosicoccaceae bacterium]